MATQRPVRYSLAMKIAAMPPLLLIAATALADPPLLQVEQAADGYVYAMAQDGSTWLLDGGRRILLQDNHELHPVGQGAGGVFWTAGDGINYFALGGRLERLPVDATVFEVYPTDGGAYLHSAGPRLWWHDGRSVSAVTRAE